MNVVVSNKKEKGAIMIMLAIFLVPILLCISLAIDTSSLSTTHTQLERISNSMALAALEEYLGFQEEPEDDGAIEKDVPDNFTDRISAAKERAANIGKLQSNIPVGMAGSPILFGSEEITQGGVAELFFGKWWFEEPIEGCTGANANNASECCFSGAFDPCFVETSVENDINAVRLTVSTKTEGEGKFKKLFSNFLFGEEPVLNVSATAAAVPRNGVFLIDMSRSTTFATHSPAEQQSGDAQLTNASEYSVLLHSDFSCSDWVKDTGSCTATAQTEVNDYCDNNFTIGSAKHTTCLAHCPRLATPREELIFFELMTEPNSGNPNTDHKRSDYDCFEFNYEGRTEHYLVDMGTAYDGPEPLNTIMDGVHEALNAITERSIVGDRVAFVAFDNSILPTSTGLRTFGPFRHGEPEFNELYSLTDTDNSGTLRDRAEKFLFPASAPGRGNTNISAALFEAREILRKLDNFASAQNFVVLFSDGVTSCYNREDTELGFADDCMMNGKKFGQPRCLAPSTNNVGLTDRDVDTDHPLFLPAEPYPDGWNAYSVHLMGLQEAVHILSRQNIVEPWPRDEAFRDRHQLPPNSCSYGMNSGTTVESYVDLGIKFHYFPIGSDENITPFSYLQSNNTGSGCANDDDLLASPHQGQAPIETRETFADLAGLTDKIKDECENGSSNEQCNYFIPSDITQHGYVTQHVWLYAGGVHPTGGIYAPVRRSCREMNGSAGCNIDSNSGQTAYEQQLETACENTTPNDPISVNNLTASLRTASSNVTNPPKQMLICDPQCRKRGDQVKDNIRKIFEENPFLLVD